MTKPSTLERLHYVLSGVAAIGIVLFGVTGYALGFAADVRRSLTFHRGAGTVRQVCEEEDDPGGLSAECFISVDGEPFITTVTPQAPGDAERLRACIVGRKLTLFYNPEHPGESVITRHIEGGVWLGVLMLAPLALFTGVWFLRRAGVGAPGFLKRSALAAWHLGDRRAAAFGCIAMLCGAGQIVIAVFTPWPWDLVAGVAFVFALAAFAVQTAKRGDSSRIG